MVSTTPFKLKANVDPTADPTRRPTNNNVHSHSRKKRLLNSTDASMFPFAGT